MVNLRDDHKPRVLVMGNSHTQCLIDAQPNFSMSQISFELQILRLHGGKREEKRHDMSFSDALALAKETLTPSDYLITLFGGNEYNKLGLLQTDPPFDIVTPDYAEADTPTEVIPIALLNDHFDRLYASVSGSLLLSLREATNCSVFCLAPAPPKSDSDFIAKHADAFFRKQGLTTTRINPARIRRQLWLLQQCAMERFCREIGISVVHCPPESVDAAGFLRREFYANDATHANSAYGCMVLDQISKIIVGGNGKH